MHVNSPELSLLSMARARRTICCAEASNASRRRLSRTAQSVPHVKEKIEVDSFLSQHGWLSFTPPEFRASVLARIEIHDFDKGEAVYRAGDTGGGLWALVEGTVEIESVALGAGPQLVHFGVPGFWFGEGPLIFNVPRIVSVIAGRPSTLVTLPLADCRDILDADPPAWRWVALHCAMTTDIAVGVVTDLLLRDPAKRTAALLLRLAGVRSHVFRSDRPSPIYLSQEKLAQLVNLSRNTIIPLLHEFAQSGCIEIGYGEIRVKNIGGLTEMISRDD
jgi:CRP/FNR family transcriptional regulator, cyclic AMP receptor protein